MYVSFFTSQPGKCRSVKKSCQWQVFSVGHLFYRWGTCRRSECMHQAVRFEKMLAFLREGVDFVDTLKAPVMLEPFCLQFDRNFFSSLLGIWGTITPSTRKEHFP